MAGRRRREEKRQRVSGRRRAEEHKSGYASKIIQLPEGVRPFIVDAAGTRRISIIPYIVKGDLNPWAKDGELHFERTFWQHRDVGAGGDAYPCLMKTFNRPCPICNFRATLLKDPDADEEMVKSLAPKERQLWNVLDLDDEERGVQVWEVSFHLFGKQLDARVNNSDEEDGYEFFADPVDGMWLKVGFEEKSFGSNNFYEAVSIDFKDRPDLTDELLQKAVCLDECLIEYDFDKLKEIFLQTEDDDVRKPKDDGDEEPAGKDEGGGRRRRGGASSAKSKSEEDKSSANDAPPSEEPAPRRRRRAKPAEAAKDMPKASDFGIEVNMIADHDEIGTDLAIIGISNDETAVYVLDLDDKKHTVAPNELKNLGPMDEEDVAAAAEEKPDKNSGGKSKSGAKSSGKSATKDKEPDDEWDDDWGDED